MVFISLEVSSWIGAQRASNGVFHLSWAPEIANESRLSLFEEIKSSVNSLFFGNKPLVDL